MNNCTLTDLERSTGKFCRLMNCQACKDYRTKMIKKRKIKSDIYETTINEIIHAMNRLDSDLWTHTVENIDELKTDEIILIARGEKSNDIRKYIDKQMRDCGTEGKEIIIENNTMQPPENFIKLLDDWCYLNADCNLPAWVSAVYRDKDMSNEFIDYLGELLDLKQG